MRIRPVLPAAAATAAVLAASVAWAAPAGIADDRLDAIDGPMAEVLIRPEDFWIDPDAALVDVDAAIASVDGARARALVESMDFPRTAQGPASGRDDAVAIVTQALVDAGLTPWHEPVERRGVVAPNVVAEVPGTRCPERMLVVGAHWDSAHPDGEGADDNATGIAGMAEIARATAAQPLPVTVRFVGFAFEEAGYVGSRAMAADLAASGTDVVGAVSLDMIGFTSPAPDPLSGLDASDHLVVVADPDSEALPNAYAAAAHRYTPEVPLFGLVIDPEVLPDINRSDHASFEAEGFDGMIANDVGVVRNPNYHEAGDVASTLDWDFLTGNIRALAAGTATFASVDQDGDGIAEVCQGGLVDPDPPAPPATTAPPTSSVPPGAPAPAAAPRLGAPTYSG